MKAGVESFYKVFDEFKKRYSSVNLEITYKTFWTITVEGNGKTFLSLKGMSSDVLFNNAAVKLLNTMKEEENK